VSAARSLSGIPDPGAGVNAALRAIVSRLAAEREPLARRIAERLAAEAPPSVPRGDSTEELEDRVSFSLELIDGFLASLNGAAPVPPAQVERIRQIAARRVHERVALGSFLHSARVWGELVWEAVVVSTRMGERQEREAAIQIASRVMRQVDAISSVAIDAYLDEITDRGLLRRDLMDALISGEEQISRRLARSLHIKLADSYIVVVVRGEDMHGEAGGDEPLQARVTLDRIVESTRRHVRPVQGSLLTGVRQGDLIVLFPASTPGDLQLVRDECAALAQTLPADVSLGMSACHRGLPSIARAYSEATEAAEIADRLGIRGRAVGLEDVLVDHLLRASDYAQRILVEAMQPVVDYDRQHGAALIATLNAYIQTRFNLTKSAGLLSVHPNTVVYRLGRIHELAGRDPHVVDDLLVLWLGLKVIELRAGQSP
jgi:sugar diacid utilization regulator